MCQISNGLAQIWHKFPFRLIARVVLWKIKKGAAWRAAP
jgi:hypothetical protein